MNITKENAETLIPLKTLLSAVRGVFIGLARNLNNFHFTSVVTDSRYVVPGCLFIPLVGKNQDGHKYIPQAIEKGASVIFINKNVYQKDTNKYMEIVSDHSTLSFIAVMDTLTALQDAAAAYTDRFPNLIKIGITGSSGKTTTKEMIVSVLKQKYNVVYTQGNMNSETGLPLSVFNIRAEHEAGVFELGMNRRNEIGEIAAVLKPKYAVITNIGTAHIGILGSRDNIAEEKRKIFKYIPEDGAAFIPAADDFADFISEDVKGKIIRYGDSIPAAESGIEFVKDNGLDSTIFNIDGISVNLKMPGIYNYRNALAAAAVGRELGLSAEQIKAGLEAVVPVSGRMETETVTLKGGANVTLIKDYYNANPDSVKSVIEFCNTLKSVKNRIYVLGDMLELGDRSAEEHSEIGVKASEGNPELIIFIGKEMKYASAAAKRNGYSNSLYITDSDEEAMMLAAQFIIDCADSGDLVLLKGSRGLALERIVPLITDKRKN